MTMAVQPALVLGGMSFLALAVLAGLWVHADSQRSSTKTAGRYVMQLHLFCLLFGILLLSLSYVVLLTPYSDVIKRLIGSGMVIGGVCFAIRSLILAVTRNPNVYQVPNRLASGFGTLFAIFMVVSIFAILIGIVLNISSL